MHSRCKSTPRADDFLEQIFGITSKKYKNKRNFQPPEQHLHKEKKYLLSSPLRNRKKIIEARSFRSPLSDKNLENKSKTEVLEYICSQKNKEILNTKNFFKSCLQKMNQLKETKFSSENCDFFSIKE